MFQSLLLFISSLWLAGFIYSNDFSVPTKDIEKFKKVLLIFPHADDEVLNSGGLIKVLSENRAKVTLVILTKGEKGNPDAHMDENLKAVRTKEAQDVSKLLGVTTLIQEDFGDGELVHKKRKLQSYIDKTIRKIKPDLIITYDLSGLYGHPDHLVVSEVITHLHKLNAIRLWYVSFPKRILAMMKLPEHMANDPEFKDRRVYPTHRVSVGNTIFTKIKAVSLYESQKESFRDALPVKFIPGAFFYSMQLFEYFHEVT